MASKPSSSKPPQRRNADPYANLKAGQKARQGEASFFTNRDGTISVFRVSLLIGILGALLIGGGVLAFNVDQQSRRAPLEIRLPDGAQQWGGPNVYSATWREVYYRVQGGDPQAVADFYDQRMAEHYGAAVSTRDRERCQRVPPVGEYTNIPDSRRGPDGKTFDPSFVPGESIAYLWRCMFDRSGMNSTQWTKVTIYPGVDSRDPNRNAFGDVVIVYEQRWQP
jgi:hypothetical protein